MNVEETNKLIDNLLVFTNNEIEVDGKPINGLFFDYTKNGEDAAKFMSRHNVTFHDDLDAAVKKCLTRGFLKNKFAGVPVGCSISLTEEGQGRAISVIEGKNIAVPQQKGSTLHIGTLNTNGNTQIGDNNTQHNITSAIELFIEQIDNSAATEQEKKEVKNRLKSLLEHPITNTIIGVTLPVLLASLGVI